MMYNYCTLFNSNYLTRGLAMYESLKKNSEKFHLYIFAFDDRSYILLKKLNLEFTTIISLREFENEDLLKIKGNRSVAEYCWTCTPYVVEYSIEKYKLGSCVYLDADLYFFSDPSILIKEMNSNSVLITEHRYTPKYDQTDTSGVYCVQFMVFKNDENGIKVLEWWRDACQKWCYARFEDGKFGDQKYLDDWLERFEGVHVLQNLGGGVAPWNVQQYNLEDKEFRLVFYHFHNFNFLEGDKVDFGYYKLTKSDVNILYKPYIKHLVNITFRLKKMNEIYDYNNILKKKDFNWKDLARSLKRKVKGVNNIYYKKDLL